MMKRIGRLSHDQRGFTFLEMIVAMAIGALVVGTAVVALFQFNSITRQQQDTLIADQRLQNVAMVLSRDVLSASDGTVAGDSLVLDIPAYTFNATSAPVTSTITYTLSSSDLSRADGSSSAVIARDVSDVDFGPSGAISATVQVTITEMVRGQTRDTVLVLHRRLTD